MDSVKRELILPFTTQDKVKGIIPVAATEEILGYLCINAGDLATELQNLEPTTKLYFKIGQKPFVETVEPSPVDSFFDGRLVIDREKNIITLDDRTLKLPFCDFNMLSLLTAYPNSYMEKRLLYKNAWMHKADPIMSKATLRTVDVHIRRLRKALSSLALAEPTYSKDGIIKTSRDFGYGFFTKDIVLAPRATMDTHES